MDKQLLNALDNLSEALVMISEALENKGSSNTATTNALQSGDFSTQINEINIAVKSIKSDTEAILKNQETILEMSKKKSEPTNVIEESGDKKSTSKLKDGIGTILLIAVAVLAIGLAFKIVGDVDFLSVIGLSLAMLVMATAFEKIAQLDLPKDKLVDTGFVLVIIAAALTISSWVLSLIKPIDPMKLLTGILIAGMFTVISFGLTKIINAIGGENLAKLGKSILLLPILLPAIALGIAMSSWVLSLVTTISPMQGLTAILIAGMFTVISYGLAKLLNALSGLDPADIIAATFFLPILLPVIAFAIAASSWVLSLVTPIEPMKLLTAILIAAVFTVISYGLAKILNAVKGIDPATMLAAAVFIPIIFPILALSIAASSWVLDKTTVIKPEQFITAIGISILFIAFAFALKLILPSVKNLDMGSVFKIPIIFTLLTLAIAASAFILYSAQEYLNGISFESMFKILVFSVCLAVSIAVLALSIWLVNKLGGVEDYIMGGLSILVIAATIALSSLIISEGEYGNYPDWKWALGAGLSLLIFGIAALALGILILSTSGLGLLAIAAGAAAILIVAETIVLTSKILSKGQFGNYPDWRWALGTGMSMAAFGVAMLGLGVITAIPGGTTLLENGSQAVLLIAQTIVDSAEVLANGNFTGGPTVEWAGGVAIALGAFAPIYAMLVADGIMKIFGGGGVGPDDFATAIRTVSRGIVDAAIYFSDPKDKDGKSVKAVFKGGPSKEWSEGVGLAISAFAPVYSALAGGGFFSNKVTPDDMKSGIETITDGIIVAAGKFADSKAVFDISLVPSATWGKNVGSALMAFTPVFEALNNSSMFTSGDTVIETIFKGITWTAQAIINVAHKFSKVKSAVWSSAPKKDWVNSVKSTISTFIGISDSLKDVSWIEMNSIDRVASRIVNTANILHSGKKFFSMKMDPNYVESLSSNILGFSTLAKKLTEINQGQGTIDTLFGQDPVSKTANSMVKLAGAYDKLANSLKKFGSALTSIDGKKVDLIRRLTGNLAVMAAMNENAFSNMMETLENKASVFSKLLDADLSSKKGATTVGGKKKPEAGAKKEEIKNKYGNTSQQLDLVIDLLNNINHNTSSLDDFLAKQGFKADAVVDLTMKK